MLTIPKGRAAVAALVAGVASAAAVAPARGQPSASAFPPLAAGIRPAADWTAPTTAYVVTNGAGLYRVPAYDPAQATGETLKRGERPQVLAEANHGLYLLIGRNGRGIGYAPRSLLCPADLCRDLTG